MERIGTFRFIFGLSIMWCFGSWTEQKQEEPPNYRQQ